MKLNHDCIRDILLYLESLDTVQLDDDDCAFIKEIQVSDLYVSLPKWSNEDIYYCLFNMEQAGFIDASFQYSNDAASETVINYMTFSGHEFLDSIRDEERWRRIKKGLSAVRNYSLSAMSSIAEGITSGAINTFLNQN